MKKLIMIDAMDMIIHYIDGDIVLLNKLDLLIDVDCDVDKSSYFFKENADKFGIYNAGFMFIKNREMTRIIGRKCSGKIMMDL